MKQKGAKASKEGGWQPLDFLEEERWPTPEKLIILAAAPGATIAKEQNPHLPISPEEIVKSHVEAYKAGASMVHVHVRDEKGIPSADCELYKRVILEIKNKCPEIIIDCCFAFPFTEDSIYMYPHKNDLIKSSAEVVTKVRRIAEELGREIATPKEARKILKLGM